MPNKTLRIHSRLDSSRSNGPGHRAVLWLQGCTLKCPGCFNPQTHSNERTSATSVDDLVAWVNVLTDIEGITVSGGEPLQQASALIVFLEKVRIISPHLSIILFTGYDVEELEAMPFINTLKLLCDVIIAGRYRQEDRVASQLIGSSNKQMIFNSSVYTKEDFVAVPPTEIIITQNGMITATGINPLNLQEAS